MSMLLFGLAFGFALPVGMFALWWVGQYGPTWSALWRNLRRVWYGDSPVRYTKRVP